MTKPSVLIENVSKKFGLRLREALKYGLIDSFRRSIGMDKDPMLRKGEFWALQDINVALEPGDALGIMGVNGSGKTTLLRIINGTYSPDAGRVTLRGRIGALIAAGAGFSPMLTGRENVYISGTLLGMTPQEIRNKFDEIVAFADIGEFIDMPVRNYSSGMSVRLGFAIAVLGQPEILLVDEVLAVGDIAFQKKCYERIFALRNEGVTILLVSHSPGAIWSVCNKGIVLSNGKSSGILNVEDTCKLYDDMNFKAQHQYLMKEALHTSADGNIKGGTGDALVSNFMICDIEGNPTAVVEFSKPFYIMANLHINTRIDKAIFRISVSSAVHKGIAVIDSYEQEQELFDLHPSDYKVVIKIESQNFRPGSYALSCAVLSKDMPIMLYFDYNAGSFVIMNDKDNFLYAYDMAYMHLPARFTITEVKSVANQFYKAIK